MNNGKDQMAALVRGLKRSERLEPDVITERQRRQVAEVAIFAHRHSPHFRARLDAAGLVPADLARADGLAALPILSRRDIQSAGDNLYCQEFPTDHGPLNETQTSGSTGEPVVVKRTRINRLMWNACTVRSHIWHRRDPSLKLAAIRANVSAFRRQPSWGPPMQLMEKTGPSEAMPITTDVTRIADWLVEFAPDTLIIYPSTLTALAHHCQRIGSILPSIAHFATVGETVSPDVRAVVQQVFNAKIEDLYSSQEVGVIAIQCPDGTGYHVMDESVIVEVLDADGQPCAEGQVGRIVVSDLHNFATPLIRYGIGDYAETGGTCSCGRGLTLINRILGRERNLIAMPDGSRHWPLVGFSRFREVAPVAQYQLIQHDIENIEVRLVTERPMSAEEESALGTVIQEALGHPFQVEFQYFKREIPRSTGGKFEEFSSKVT